MPTFVHGKNTYFSMQPDTGGAEINISDHLNEVGFPREVDAAETTTFGGNGAREYIVGLTDATVALSGLWSATLDGYFGDLTVIRTFTYGPSGNATGRPKYTGSAIITSYETTNGVEDPVSFSAELQVTGPVTRGTFA